MNDSQATKATEARARIGNEISKLTAAVDSIPLVESGVPLEKAEGALLALASGDALGWPQEFPRNVCGRPQNKSVHVEFEQWTRRSGGRFRPFEEIIRAGDYSDDTQLTLAVARCRTKHGDAWWKALTQMELPLWPLYERGGGGATKRAASAWADGGPPWRSDKEAEIRQYFDAGGNGVAMRVLPHALFLSGQDCPDALMHDVVRDGIATHGHPRALVGATVYAYAAWWLARRRDTLGFGELLDLLLDEAQVWGKYPQSDRDSGRWSDAAQRATRSRYRLIWDETAQEMQELLEVARTGVKDGALADDHAVLKELGCLGRTKGAGTTSAAAAAYLVARHAAQPIQGILRPAFEKGADTDTLAAMVGGLLGCLAGNEWLPSPWLQVQDADYLRTVASHLAQGPNGVQSVPIETAKSPQSIVSDLDADIGELSLGCERKAYPTALPDPRPIAKSIAVKAWRLRTSDGQTMYVTRVEQLAKGASIERRQEGRQDSSTSGADKPAPPALPSRNSKDDLYVNFCELLPNIANPSFRPKDVEQAFVLVPSQVKKWLERAEQGGIIQRVSKKPARFVLAKGQLVGVNVVSERWGSRHMTPKQRT